MKRLLVLILATCMFLGLAACAKSGQQNPTTVPTTTPTTAPTTTPTTTPTTAPTTPPVPTVYKFKECFDGTKEGVPEFFKLLSEQIPDHVTGLTATAEADCYNITPPGADPKTDLQVFMSYKTGRCYIVQDGKIRLTINYLSSMLLCDIDNNGEKDLLFMTIWGSGIERDLVCVYSATTQKATAIYLSERGYKRDMLWVAASGADVYFEGKTEADDNIQYPILSVEKAYENNKLSGYAVTGIYGSVVYKDGEYQFVPYQE